LSACDLELTSWLNSGSRFLIQQLIMSRLVKYYSAFYGTQRLFIMFTKENHWTQFSASRFQFKMSRHFCSICSNSIGLHRASTAIYVHQGSQLGFFILLLPHVSVLHVPSIPSSLILSPWWGVVHRSVAVWIHTEMVDAGDKASDLYSAGERFEPRSARRLPWLRIFVISSAPPPKFWNNSFNRPRLFHSSPIRIH
jgi:hypothetical protein